jgi:hypothetical protein
MTPLGYALLPVGLLGLLLSTKWLYRLFVFWTLFSASSAINFGEAEKGSGLQVWMFFGSLWLLRLILEHIPAFSFPIDRRVLRPCLWVTAFLFVGMLSLIMPLYINGRLIIASPYLGDDFGAPLYFTGHHVTQLLYLVFGVTITICVAHYNLSDEQRHETERTILLSAIFVAIWGLFQFVCNVTGISYPDYIFNNSASPFALGFSQTLENVGVRRISSVALEPSVFAQTVVALLPLTLPAWIGRGRILSVALDRFSTVLFLIVLILSTSSTAYVGILILALLLLLVLLRTRIISVVKATVLAACAVAVIVTVAVVSVSAFPVLGDVAKSTLLDKSETFSGLERVMTIELAYGYFVRYPLLGIGWGSAVSHDLIIMLLSNVGVIGALTFLGAMWYTMRSSWRVMDSLDSQMGLSRAAWFLSLAVTLSISIFSGFPLAMGNFWVAIGMVIATSWRSQTERERQYTPALA